MFIDTDVLKKTLQGRNGNRFAPAKGNPSLDGIYKHFAPTALFNNA